MRVTRAAIRILEDEAEQAAHVPLPSTPRRERAPLGDITGSIQNDALEIIAVVDPEKPTKTPGESLGKSSPRKDKLHEVDHDGDADMMEVLEDDVQSETSSAAEEACRELLRPTLDSEVYRLQVRGPGRPSTPPSKAVKRARKHLTPKSRTPRFDPKIHASPDVLRSPTRAERLNTDRRDSFLDAVKTRSPVKAVVENQPTVEEEEEVPIQDPEVVLEAVDEVQEMDTPIGSPAAMEAFRKRRSRIEDSFDALDAMEDMLDEVKESLANVDRPHTAFSVSPEDRRQSQIQQEAHLHVSKSAPQTPRPRSIDTRPRSHDRASLRVANESLRRTASTRSLSKPVSTASSNNSRSSSRPGDSSVRPTRAVATKPVALPSRPKAPVSPVTKKPFVPERFQKPTTTSTFKLPGETVSARIKAQREARQAGHASTASTASANLSDVTQKRKSTGPEVRMTAAALARLSIARGEKPATATTSTLRSNTTAASKPTIAAAAARATATTNRATAPTSSTAARLAARKPATRSGAAAATSAATSTRTGTITTTTTTTIVPTKPPAANTSAKRTVNPIGGSARAGKVAVEDGPGLKRSSSTRSIGSLPATKRRAAAVTEGGSTTVTKATATTATKKAPVNDRAEAARRARVEAAERGRQASRLWAEKMRKRRSGIVDEKAAEAVVAAATAADADAGKAAGAQS